MWLLPVLLAAGCGGGVQPLNSTNTEVPVLFLYIVGQNTQSILAFQQDAAEAISSVANSSSVGTTFQPSAVVVHPSGNFLYASNFGSNDVTMYSRNSTTGVITPLGSIPPAQTGTGPIALGTDSKGQFLYVLNQGSGSISAFSINSARGLLTELAGSPFAVQPGPTAIAISQSSNFVYVANGTSSTVSAFSINSDGTLSAVPGSPFSTAFGTNLSWVVIDPKGRFVYASDFANNAIYGFAVQSNGALSPLSGSPFTLDASNPLGMTTDTTGSFLYVADEQINLFSSGTTGTVSGYTIGSSGALKQILGSPFFTGNNTTASSFVIVDPSNTFLYNTNPSTSNITASMINSSTGAVTLVPSSPIGVSTSPGWIAVSTAVNEP